jgi:DnaJ family protein C protein 2
MCRPNFCLALEDSDFKGQVVLAPWAGAVALGSTTFAQKKEFAGHAFHEFTNKAKRNGQPSGSSGSDREPASSEDLECPTPERDAKKDKKKKNKHTECLQLTDDIKDIDLYELMEVTEAASEKDIKLTYRRLVLERHPDKLGREASEADREHFARTQTAFEILSDPTKRRQYDSSKEFDDTVPTSFNKLGGKFYATFRGVFEKNARFSTIKPVPPLGDENTPIAEVRQFYRFWKSFDSWRDPLADAQLNGEEICNLEEAECREERRWMEQENARIARRFKKAETERVQGFVQLAFENDPRLIAEAEARKQEKERAAQEKADAERAAEKARAEAEAEALAKAQAAEDARKAEKESKKAERDAARRVLKETRQTLRRDILAFGDVESAVLDSQLQLLLQEKSIDDCAALRADVLRADATTESVVEAVHALLRGIGVQPRTPTAEDIAALREAANANGAAQPAKEEEPEPVVVEEEKPKKLTAAEKKAAAEAEKKRIAEEEARAKKEEKKRREREAQKAKEEQRAAERLEAEKAKEAEAKAARDAASQAAEAERKAAKVQKEKQKADEKAAEANNKKAELLALETKEAFEEDRQQLMADFERVGVTLEGVEPEALAAFAAIAAGFEYEEDETVSRGALILREAGVRHADLAFPAPQAIEVATTLRNTLKKVRSKLRSAVADLLKTAKAPKGVNPAARYEAIMTGAVVAESAFTYVPAPKKDAAQSAEKPKAEKGGKAKGADEDLDALLAEFGVVVDDKASKKKKKSAKK